jgi:uncharacterized protein (TIGR00255 family)
MAPSVRSMTGFGRAEFEIPQGPVQIEIKSTNHRYFEFSARLPHALLSHEEDIRRLAQKSIGRGKVHLTITAPDQLVRRGRLTVDDALAREYYKIFTHLNRELGLEEKVTLRDIVRMPDVITQTAKVSERHRVWNDLSGALKKSLEQLTRSRELEGRKLAKDLASRLNIIERAAKRIQRRMNLREKQSQAASSNQQTSQKPNDITEELVRLASHVGAFRGTLKAGGEVGRKIDFIAQELVREINTTGSKCNDSEIAADVIEVKTEIEKIREQAQNLE